MPILRDEKVKRVALFNKWDADRSKALTMEEVDEGRKVLFGEVFKGKTLPRLRCSGGNAFSSRKGRCKRSLVEQRTNKGVRLASGIHLLWSVMSSGC